MNIDNIVGSTLKVTANENLNIDSDFHTDESTKSLEQLLNEQEEKKETNQKES